MQVGCVFSLVPSPNTRVVSLSAGDQSLQL
jgi:hypothetical protein